MKTILQWASWLVSAFAIYLIFMGSLCYLVGDVRLFGVLWGTYYLFAGYFIPLAILMVLLSMSFKKKGNE
jgi:hypothetical protein